MNKYQLKLLSKIILGVISDGVEGSADLDENENLVITQNEDYNHTKYLLKLKNADITNVSYYVKEWKKANVAGDEIAVPIDFDKPTTAIKISLKDGFVDDFEVNIKLVYADKMEWDKKHAAEVQKERIEKINVSLSSEGVMHTVVFSPCCKEYAYTIVKWYAVSKIAHSSGRGAIMVGGDYSSSKPFVKTFLGETKIEDKFYSNIEVAFEVGLVLTQYDSNGKKLASVTYGL